MEWFKNWFDTPYYKILYQHRDDQEAQFFITNLLKKIPLIPDEWILDLACGRGRHAKFIHQAGYKVYGIDLSQQSILEAKAFENPNLKFEVQDMRYFKLPFNFQCILSLFTSFGYFDTNQENETVLNRVYEHLKPNGFFILDFFNSQYILKNLIPHEIKFNGKIKFEIGRYVENQKIIKKIEVFDASQRYNYFESVYLYSTQDLRFMLEQNGFKILYIWGDYNLNDFNEDMPRSIFVAQKF